jgi:hypothetical protein
MRIIGFLVLLCTGANGFGQTPVKDPDTVQALLVEVRQLRQDLEAMTVASQRVQIALYGLQIQDAAVARTSQRLEEARNKRMGAENARDHIAADVQRIEDVLASNTLKGDELNGLKMRLPEMKSELERTTNEVGARQAAEAEAASQFRTEQVKLVELQDRITRLDKVLERMGGAGK